MRPKTPRTCSSLGSKSAASLIPSNNNNNISEQKPTAAAHQSLRADGVRAEKGGCCGRERLKRHWVEVAGRVWIPDIWGQEDLLKDWIDCSAFDSSLVGSSIISARDSMVEEATRATSTRFGIENSC